MEVLVRKYGGTSVAGTECLRRVAESIAEVHRAGKSVAVAVSAQGGTTDELLRRAADSGEHRSTRETDQLIATGEYASAALLAMTLQSIGVPAVSLTGRQAGIAVHGPPSQGRIAGVDSTRIHRLLGTGHVVVVAGFQGCNDEDDVVTLGRGGSDTTGVALAAALGAHCVEIYTDVDGVYTADPHIVPTARLLPVVDLDVMVEMAFAGARVLHSRAVELAAARGIGMHVRNVFRNGPATVISKESDRDMEEDSVLAVAHDLDVTRVLVHSGPTDRDLAVPVLDVLARHHAPVDLVARSGPFEDEFRMGFTIRRSDVPRIAGAVDETVAAAGGSLVFQDDVAKVSLIGTGLLNRPDYTSRVLSALRDADIATSWVSTSQLRTSVIVPEAQVVDAVALLHKEFGLDRDHLEDAPKSPV